MKRLIKSTLFHFTLAMVLVLLVILDLLIFRHFVNMQETDTMFVNIKGIYIDENECLYLLTDKLGIMRYYEGNYIGRFNVSAESDIISVSSEQISIYDYESRTQYIYSYLGELINQTVLELDRDYNPYEELFTRRTSVFKDKAEMHGVLYELKCSGGYYRVYANNSVVYHTPESGYRIMIISIVNTPVVIIMFLFAAFNYAVVICRIAPRISETRRKVL